LASPRAQATLRRFHRETFKIDAYRSISKDPSLGWSEGLESDLEQAATSFFDRIFDDQLGLREVLLSDRGFVSAAMAPLVGIADPGGDGLVEVMFPPERQGFFTQLPFLISQSFDLTPDSIGRGAALNYDVLCADIPPDPATPISPPTPVTGSTNRERVTEVTADPGCAGCHHQYLNPLGFAFENFDGLGQVRDEDDGIPVDTTGSYPFVEGRLAFDDAPGLMRLLAESRQAHTCFAAHLAEFGLARELGPEDASLVDALAAASLDDQGSQQELVLQLVTSPAFTIRQDAP
jgi:hypothetical protein